MQSRPSSPTKTQIVKAVKIVDGVLFCLCDKPAIRGQSNSKNNPGRYYYKCAKSTGRCNTWRWEDELPEFQSPERKGAQTPPKSIKPPETPTTVRTRVLPTTPRTPNDPERAARTLKRVQDALANGKDDPVPGRSKPISPKERPHMPPPSDPPPRLRTPPPRTRSPPFESPSGMDMDVDVDSNPFNDDSYRPSYMSSNSSRSNAPTSTTNGTKSSVIVDSSGSPKRPRPRAGKERADEWTSAGVDPDSIQSFQSHQNDPISPAKVLFNLPTKSSQAEIEKLLVTDPLSSGGKYPDVQRLTEEVTDALILSLNGIPKHMKYLEKLRRDAEEKVGRKEGRIHQLEEQLEKMQKEITGLSGENRLLKSTVTYLEETVKHYKSGGRDIT